MAKRNNVWMALECARKARDILGAAGITDQHSVIRHVTESRERLHVRRHTRHSHLDHRARYNGLECFWRVKMMSIIPSGGGVEAATQRIRSARARLSIPLRYKADSAGSFDFAQDDVAWKLVKLKNE